MEFIAVAEVQRPQAGDFLPGLSPHSVTLGLAMHRLREGGLLVDIVQDTLPDLIQRVALAQFVEPEITLCAWGLQGRVFQGLAVLSMDFDLIAHFAHHPQEIPFRCSGADSPVNVGPDAPPVGGLAAALGLPFGVVLCLPAWVLDHRNGIFPAQAVRYLPHPGVVGGGVVELFSINPGHGVE